MKLVSGIIFALLLVIPVSAQNVVNASAPAVNYIWSPTGTVYVTDMTSDLLNGGKLQSRIFQTQAGSPAGSGKWVYEYRVNLTNAVGILHIPYVSSISFFPGSMLAFDYNYDSVATDHVFNISSGGLGTKGVSGVAFFWWGLRRFDFSSPIFAGGSPGTGESSYFFGFTSSYPPEVGTINVQTDGGTISLSGYVPNY
jgi:hypothetical protein